MRKVSENNLAVLIKTISDKNKSFDTNSLTVVLNGLVAFIDKYNIDRLNNVITPYVEKVSSVYASKGYLVLEKETRFNENVENRFYTITPLGEEYFTKLSNTVKGRVKQKIADEVEIYKQAMRHANHISLNAWRYCKPKRTSVLR